MHRNRRMGDIRLVQDLVKSKAGMRNVRILIPTDYGLDHEEDNSRTLRMEFATNRKSIVVNGEEVKDVEEFAYLGAIVEKKRKVEAVKTLGTDCRRREVHSRGYGGCG